METILFCYGTRPELTKLAPLIYASRKKFRIITLFSGQHDSLYNDVKNLVKKPNYDLSYIPKDGTLNRFIASRLLEFQKIYEKEKPSIVIVQGDTVSAYLSALCAFHLGIKIGHVEAGLRTYNVFSPYPEEMYRRNISSMATYNWCPTDVSKKNLEVEKINGEIVVTGNTSIDMLRLRSIEQSESNKVVITLHRRENKEKFIKILNQINSIADTFKDLDFLFPAHPNPGIQNVLDVLNKKRVKIVKPIKYTKFVHELARCAFLISDSGGLQEEACFFRKKVLVCRDTTERPEAVSSGFSRLFNENSSRSKIIRDVEWALSPVPKNRLNPYGDGYASERIVNFLMEKLR